MWYENLKPIRTYESLFSQSFIALDKEKGIERWRKDLGEVHAQIIGRDQHLLFITDTNLPFPSPPLLILEASTGQVIRSIEQGDHYLLAGGTIYSWSNERLAALTVEAGVFLWEIPLS